MGRLSPIHRAGDSRRESVASHPLFRLERAGFRVRAKGERPRGRGAKSITVKPKKFKVDGTIPTACGYQLSLLWWRATLAGSTSVVC